MVPDAGAHAENLKLRAEAQLEAADVRPLRVIVRGQGAGGGRQERKRRRSAELAERLATAKAELQPKFDAVARARDALVAAEAARVAAAEAARKTARNLGPISVFITRKTQHLYVRQGSQSILDVPSPSRIPIAPSARMCSPPHQPHREGRTPLARKADHRAGLVRRGRLGSRLRAVDRTHSFRRARAHPLIIHATDENVIMQFGLEKPVFRILVNTMGTLGAVGFTTGLMPSMTLGAGGEGGSITGDNITVHHLYNVKRLAYELNLPPAEALRTPGSDSGLNAREVETIVRQVISSILGQK